MFDHKILTHKSTNTDKRLKIDFRFKATSKRANISKTQLRKFDCETKISPTYIGKRK